MFIASDSDHVAPRSPHFLGRSILFSILVCLLSFVLYAATTCRGALWQDSGMFHLRVFNADYTGDLGLALSHPLYIFLARGFANLISAGDYAWRVNLFSALAAAVTLGNLFLATAWLTNRFAPAVLTVLTLGVAHTFWSYSTVAEVYTLYTAFFSAELVCLVGYFKKHNPRWLTAMFFFNGLALANHNLALLELPAYFVLILWLLKKKQIRFGRLFLMAGAWFLGAMPFLALIGQQILAGKPVLDVMHSALTGGYQNAVFSVDVSYSRIPLYILLNFPTPNLLLIFSGLVYLCKPSPQKPLYHTLILLFVVFFIFAARYRVPDQYTFFIPAYVIMAMAAGVAANQFFRSKPKLFLISLLLALLPIPCYAFGPDWAKNHNRKIPGVSREVPFRNEYRYFLQPWKHNDRSTEQYVEQMIRDIPPGSIILADNTILHPLLYCQQARGDLVQCVLYSQNQKPVPDSDTFELGTLQTVNPAFKSPPILTTGNLTGLMTQHPVYVTSNNPAYCPAYLIDHYPFEPVGVVFRITP